MFFFLTGTGAAFHAQIGAGADDLRQLALGAIEEIIHRSEQRLGTQGRVIQPQRIAARDGGKRPVDGGFAAALGVTLEMKGKEIPLQPAAHLIGNCHRHAGEHFFDQTGEVVRVAGVVNQNARVTMEGRCAFGQHARAFGWQRIKGFGGRRKIAFAGSKPPVKAAESYTRSVRKQCLSPNFNV